MKQVHRSDYVVDRRLFMVAGLALCVGVLSTLAADVLLGLIRFFTNLFFFQTFSLAARSPAENTLGLAVIALPVLGGLIVGLMARFGSDKIRGHGIPEAMEAILFNKSRMSPRVAFLKPVSSGIVIGSGGPFGAEGPIIMTGGSLGSLLAQFLHLTAAERKTLLVAGACAGMTAVFGSPVAAVMLAVELLLFELRPRSLLPVALACAVAAFLRPSFFTDGPLFPLQLAPVSGAALLSCVIAGLASGALAVLLTQALYKTEDIFSRLPLHWMWWPALGGLVVGIGGYFQPRALGVGYDVIGDLLNNHLLLSAALALLAVKAVIWVVALGSGTSGGVLAPLLMLGAGLGLLLSPVLPGASAPLWALACMSGMLGSVLGAPLTAIIFAFELTHASTALLPLLLTTMVAYGFSVLTLKRSIMTEKIARRGLHVAREYVVDPLTRQHVDDLMSTDFVAIPGDMPVAEALAHYFSPSVEAYAGLHPVVMQGRLLGMLARQDLEQAEGVGLCCADVARRPQAQALLLPGQTGRMAAGQMARSGADVLPVVNDIQEMHLLGLLHWRDLLRPSEENWHEETVREKLR